MIRHPILATALAAQYTGAFAADANAGRNVFRQQCALCQRAEPNDRGAAQGPNLSGVLGRRAAADAAFPYTSALREASLSWNARTLDRFLGSPTTLVPGTAMVNALPKQKDRADIIAYFRALQE